MLLSACGPGLVAVDLEQERPGLFVGEADSISLYATNHATGRRMEISVVSDDPWVVRLDSAACEPDVSCEIVLTGIAVGTTTVRGGVTQFSEEVRLEFLVDVFEP